ncbi:MAG TPA: UbiA family prenyltransferase [Candidatus Kapabacteria bacterium]|nr:UbiA family prenyltransferase [Candidatus Kapabacteria bacterium]HOM04885.1 UbiA family prenyltransferase [Candidatus Kapabacteria bacterium]
MNKIDSEFNNIPLCVDLDGTLIAGDTLLDSTLIAIKRKPFILLLLPFWILQGKLFFKEKIHQIAEPDYSTLVYRDEVIEFIEAEKHKGRQIVLATASSQNIADKIADELGIFDLVLGSGNGVNLRSSHKRYKLIELFGEQGFDYIGDSSADIEVFRSARKAYLVEPGNKVLNKAKAIGNLEMCFGHKPDLFKLILKEIRIYQWVKNILIFLPILLAHIIPIGEYAVKLVIAFLSFSFVASSVYVLNDLLDISSDRQHPTKRNRPFASGALSAKIGFLLFPLLLILGFAPSIILLPSKFNFILLVYFVLTTLYSFYLKRVYVVDILILSLLYTLRLIAGAAVVDVLISPWLIAFSVFIFISLACIKRYTELYSLTGGSTEQISGRGYIIDDINLIKTIGVSSGLISILVFMLYVNSKEVLALYKHPIYLYVVAFFFLYWIIRMWFIAVRGKMTDDPIVFTLRDKTGLFIFALIILIVLGASL